MELSIPAKFSSIYKKPSDIVLYPAPVLRKIASPVHVFNIEVAKKAKRMNAAFDFAKAAGIAAPQLGWSKRIIVVATSRGNPLVMVNPEIEELSDDKATDFEGCLSLPRLIVEVSRSRSATVKYHQVNGLEARIELEGLPARILQHEIDHLDGKLMIDHAQDPSQLRWVS